KSLEQSQSLVERQGIGFVDQFANRRMVHPISLSTRRHYASRVSISTVAHLTFRAGWVPSAIRADVFRRLYTSSMILARLARVRPISWLVALLWMSAFGASITGSRTTRDGRILEARHGD